LWVDPPLYSASLILSIPFTHSPMHRKKEKDYWVKRTEQHVSSDAAHARAAGLRMHDHTSHVQVRRNAAGYEVSFSVAKWYWEELGKEHCGYKLAVSNRMREKRNLR
jgi:hypothetical protein